MCCLFNDKSRILYLGWKPYPL
uniref:Uncharacterized protein n=1 Tax=Rhizophora mucronata TaxID=61149 RepID=A0A2P2QTB4_RHIMU